MQGCRKGASLITNAEVSILGGLCSVEQSMGVCVGAGGGVNRNNHSCIIIMISR